MRRAHPVAGMAWFLVKFCVIAAALLAGWWTVQPGYVALIGQAAGIGIRYIGNAPVDAMRVEVDEAGVLNTRTSLVYIEGERRYPIQVAFLIANLPAYGALVLATGGIGWRRRLRALVFGGGILVAGHVVFLAVMYVFAREVEAAPEVPTAFGTFIMTMPFLLWILFAYWEKLAGLFDTREQSARGTPGDRPS